jgi:hypothetical protein
MSQKQPKAPAEEPAVEQPTVVEDNTHGQAPAVQELEVTEVVFEDGTVLTTYGSPKGV